MVPTMHHESADGMDHDGQSVIPIIMLSTLDQS